MEQVKLYSNEEFLNDIKINPNDLPYEFQHQPTLYYKYAIEFMEADGAEKNAKHQLEKVEANLFIIIRDEFIEAKEKFTNDLITAHIKKHDDYLRAYKEYLQAQINRVIARSRVDAFIQRKDMLIQLGANYRAEMDSYIK